MRCPGITNRLQKNLMDRPVITTTSAYQIGIDINQINNGNAITTHPTLYTHSHTIHKRHLSKQKPFECVKFPLKYSSGKEVLQAAAANPLPEY